MHLRVSQKIFCLYCVGIVYAVAMTSHENRSFSFQTFLHLPKILFSVQLKSWLNFQQWSAVSYRLVSAFRTANICSPFRV